MEDPGHKMHPVRRLFRKFRTMKHYKPYPHKKYLKNGRHSQIWCGDKQHLPPCWPHIDRVPNQDFPASIHTNKSHRGPQAPTVVVEKTLNPTLGWRQQRQEGSECVWELEYFAIRFVLYSKGRSVATRTSLSSVQQMILESHELHTIQNP